MTLTNDYIAGLFDGEGTFAVQIVIEGSKFHQIRPLIDIALSSKRAINFEVIDKLSSTLGGKIYRQERAVHYRTDNLDNLRNNILPIFEDKLIIKKESLRIFKELIEKYYPYKDTRYIPRDVQYELVDLIENLYSTRSQQRERTRLKKWKKSLEKQQTLSGML